MRALEVPDGTSVNFRAGASSNVVNLAPEKKFHPMGTVILEAGEQTFGITLLETSDLKMINKMGLYSLSFKKLTH